MFASPLFVSPGANAGPSPFPRVSLNAFAGANNSVTPGTTVDNGSGTQYRVIQELGAGCFGTVLKVSRLADGKVLAMKVQQQRDARQVAEVNKEVSLLRRLRNPHVVSFMEDFQYKQYICIVMEYCDGGTLSRHIQSRKQTGFSTLRIAGYLAQLASGLEYIHSKNVTHRDLKSDNVMMTSQMNVKISDFGCGKALAPGSHHCMTMTGGDRMIIPPEMSHLIQGVPRHGMVSPAYDMWGLGVILSELLILKLFSKDICKTAPLALNSAAEASILQEARQVHGGKFYPLLQSLLQHDPSRRAKAADVKEEVKRIIKPEAKHDPQQLKKVAQQLGVSEAQLQEAWENFQRADSSNKGFVTVGQLKQLLNVLHIDVSARALMKQFDKDASGTLDFKEFATWWMKRDKEWMPTVVLGQNDKNEQMICQVFGIPSAEYSRMREAFARLDQDDSNEISVLALWQLLTEIGINMGNDAGPLIQRVGKDWEDKSFTFDEILHWTTDNIDWQSRAFKHRHQSPVVPPAVRPPSSQHQHRPSSSSPLSSGHSSGGSKYKLGEKVLVLRSTGDWCPAEVTEVKSDSIMVTYTQLDKGSRKEIHSMWMEKFVKPASPGVW